MWWHVSERSFLDVAAESLYSNPGQWEAYESRGHCIVLAGPGSGKTKTLAAKMARMIAEDIESPRGLACITYNNECARELEARLATLGVTAGGRVFIGTVHSFSLTKIILPYAKVAAMGLPAEFAVATRAECNAAFDTALQRTMGRVQNPQNWNFRMGTYRRSILNRQSRKWHEQSPKLAGLVEAYEEELRIRGRIDFDDMPLLAVRALRAHPWLQRALLAKYPVLVVDEYQDLGGALHRMVMGLCFSAGMRLFAVGDIDQSIYGFTGANPELLEQLSEREDVQTVRLRLNYRSGTRIVAAARHALGEDRKYQAVAGAAQGAVIFCNLVGTYEQQAQYLIKELLPAARARHPDLPLGCIAVLYPEAWIGDKVAEAARVASIPVLRTDGNALYPRSSRLMQWIEQCAQWCCGGWRRGEPSFAFLGREGRRLFGHALRGDDNLLTFRRDLMLTLWACRNGSASLHTWLINLRRVLIAPLLARCPALRDEAETLDAFIKRLSAEGDSHGMLVEQMVSKRDGGDSVVLSTLHSAKGREFSVVFMFGMNQGTIPRANAEPAELAEARRLFYVGFTRAKSEVHLVSTAGSTSPFVTEVQMQIQQGT